MPDVISSMSDSFWRTAAAIKDAEETEKKTAKDAQTKQQLEVLYKLMADPTSNDATREYAGQEIAKISGLKPDHMTKAAAVINTQPQQAAQPQQPAPNYMPPMPQVDIDPSRPDALQQATIQPENTSIAPVDTTAAQQTLEPMPAPMMESPMPAGQMGPGEIVPVPQNPYMQPEQDTTDEEDYLQEFAPVAAQALEPQGQNFSPVPPVDGFPQGLFKSTKQLMQEKADMVGMETKSKAQAEADVELANMEAKAQKEQSIKDEFRRRASEAIKAAQASEDPTDLVVALRSLGKEMGVPEIAEDILGRWQDIGGTKELMDIYGESKKSVAKTVTPGEQLASEDRGKDRAAANARAANALAQSKDAQVGGFNSSDLEGIEHAAAQLGVDSAAFQRAVGKEAAAAYNAHTLKNGGFRPSSEQAKTLSSMTGAVATLQKHTNATLERKLGHPVDIEEFANTPQVTELTRAMAEMLRSNKEPGGWKAFYEKNKARFDSLYTSMGFSPSGTAIEKSVMAMAPMIAKALGHVGNLNMTEVEAAAALIPNLDNSPYEIAAMYKLITDSIEFKNAAIRDEATFKPSGATKQPDSGEEEWTIGPDGKPRRVR